LGIGASSALCGEKFTQIIELLSEGYRHDVEIFFAWLKERLGRSILLIEVTPFDLQKYRNSLEGGKPSIINRRLVGLRAFFAWAKKQGMISSNPVDDVKGTKQDDKSPQALNRQEIYKVQREAAARRQLAQAKADLVTVARVMGHSNINTTMIYTQPSHEDKVKAVEGVE
jgi:site-specific recombinase XerD